MFKRDFYNMVINNEITEEVKNYAQECIKELDTRNEKRRSTLTKTQKENLELMENILTKLEKGKTYIANDISKTFNISTQKASALLKNLAKDNKVKQIDKVKSEKGYCKGYILIENE